MKVDNSKVALIVEGGGFKSAFTAGILDIFIRFGFDPFSLYVGVSGGAMNLTSFLSKQYKRNINIITTVAENANFISIVRFLKGGNYMELKYLMDVASRKFPFDQPTADTYLGEADCRVVVTNYSNGAPAYLSVKKFGWVKTMEATGSLPIATRGYCKLAGKKYIDGGLADPLPVKRVYDWGYRQIILLRTHPAKYEADWNIESLYAPLFYKDNPKLQNLITRNARIYKREQNYIQNPPKDLHITQISPPEELKCGVISYNNENLMEDYRTGLEMGVDALETLKNG
ncbi:MAG: patatin family protein [Candidatus Marinimicrobia bacterium]|nr:patatin family protein [Candidatus Neomarinimicrobiota bacterium]